MLYFAYGSNLNLDEMAYRCPSASYLGEATIEDYELEFRYYLSVKQNKGRKVKVGVFEIKNELDWKSLDFYEGYPQLYYKKELKAIDDSGKTVKGIIYIMTKDSYKHDLRSDYGYYSRCIDGYKHCNIDDKQLKTAWKKAKNI